MKKFLFLLFISISALTLYGQTRNEDRNISYSVYACAGRAIFASSPSGPSKFPALEVRLGGGASWNFVKNFSLDARIIFGFRAKRNPYNVPGQPYTVGPPFLSVDEVASKSNHFFYDIPVSLKFDLPHPKIGIKAGANYRFYMSNDESFDWLAGQGEVGLIFGAYYRITPKISVGIDQYFGLTKVYSGMGQINGIDSEVVIRNQSTQFIVSYKF